MRIAVTSTDGINIDTHFGKAKIIYVYDIGNGSIRYLEKRRTKKYCSDNPMHAFRQVDFNKIYKVIADCKILYTQKIGAIPNQKCKSLGIKVRQVKGEIISAIGGRNKDLKISEI